MTNLRLQQIRAPEKQIGEQAETRGGRYLVLLDDAIVGILEAGWRRPYQKGAWDIFLMDSAHHLWRANWTHTRAAAMGWLQDYVAGGNGLIDDS